MQLALRTQQVIAEETNVGQVVDPLGGSYYVETLTNEYEKRIFEILKEVDARGGTDQAYRGGLVSETDRRLRLRDGAAQTVGRQAGASASTAMASKEPMRRSRCTLTIRRPLSGR